MRKTSLPVVHSLLRDAGYRVLVRTDGWSECFVQRDAERWEGRGQTEDDALDDALGKMFPSHLARMLLARHTHQPSVAVESREPEPDAGAGRASITSTIDEAPAPAPPSVETHIPEQAADLAEHPSGTVEPPAPAAEVEDAPLEPEPVAAAVLAELPAETPAVTTPPQLSIPSAHPEASVATLIAAPSTQPITTAEPPKPTATTAEPARPAAPAPTPRMRTAEALESVDRMLATIEERMGHLARMCGERQRLNMMVWICRARSIEEGHPGIRDVEHAVAKVAKRLTDIGKMFWPGSVRALQLSARPADVRREMHATWAAEPANWREATVLAERLLDEHLAKSPDAGLDEDGWADGALRIPRPADPDALFSEVDAEIKAVLIPPGEVPNGRAGELSGAEFDQLVNAARKLRWLRGAVRDDLAWGVAVGRIRRAVPSLGDRAARVRDVLDHRTKPSVPWAKLLGEAPAEVAAPGESPAELQAALGAASMSKEGLLAWLIRAFDVLNTPDLVAMVAPFKNDITSFSEETLNHPDRRVRRRLRELVKRVGSTEETAPPRKSEPTQRSVDDSADEPVADHALTALAALVRARTKGKKVLFVSNREDPELGSRLEELLGIEIAWCDGSLRRVQAQCERIKGGSYDLILSATGFQVHGVDSALARAASSSDVPYVRVNRGRPVACVQAIAREFGLTTGIYASLDSAKASSAG